MTKLSFTYLILLFPTLILTTFSSCKVEPYSPPYEHAGGYVVTKEVCNTDSSKDEWLIDLSYAAQSPNLNYGDTITLNGVFYKHMIKTSQLLPELRVIGKAVSFNFTLSASKVQSTNCTVPNPMVYLLKEMNVIASFEIR
jgi:hypothetical protein